MNLNDPGLIIDDLDMVFPYAGGNMIARTYHLSGSEITCKKLIKKIVDNHIECFTGEDLFKIECGSEEIAKTLVLDLFLGENHSMDWSNDIPEEKV